jgi:streptogramin lyase
LADLARSIILDIKGQNRSVSSNLADPVVCDAASMAATATITEFATCASNSAPIVITSGPDGNLWFTEDSVGKIGRISPT